MLDRLMMLLYSGSAHGAGLGAMLDDAVNNVFLNDVCFQVLWSPFPAESAFNAPWDF